MKKLKDWFLSRTYWAGYYDGWDDGLMDGAAAHKELILGRLEKQLDDDPDTDAMHYQNLGIEIAMQVIRDNHLAVMQGLRKKGRKNK